MKTTLVAVSGMSPAILTETAWALAREKPAIVPDEVVVITTARGEVDIHDLLLAPREDWNNRTVWETMRQAILQRTGQGQNKDAVTSDKLSKLQLSVRVIDLPDESSGVRRPAEDLRSSVDNDQAADFIVRTLAPLCDEEDNRVISSIAGGRKTMGALLYAAMSLLGKEGDRCTHVLVSEPFDTCRGFFYPDQPVAELEAHRFGPPPVNVHAPGARIELADIPFVPLRNKFAELNEPRRSFAGLVEQYSRAPLKRLVGPPRVSMDTENAILRVEGRKIRLSGREFIIAAFLHHRAVSGDPHFELRSDAEAPLNEFYQAFRSAHSSHRAIQRLPSQLDEGDLTRGLSGIRKKLTETGLAETISQLAPPRDRIGFDIADPHA